MASLSYDLHEHIIGWLKGVTFPTPPASLMLGLLTTAPDPDGTGVSEPDGNDGYARQEVTLGSITTSNGVSTVKNTVPMVFGPATANWPSVTHAGVFDDDDNLLFYGPLPASRVAPSGDSISFGANALQFRLK